MMGQSLGVRAEAMLVNEVLHLLAVLRCIRIAAFRIANKAAGKLLVAVTFFLSRRLLGDLSRRI
jgi:hypothetical protein